jgi:hypothetical protein
MSEYTEHKEIWLQPWCDECDRTQFDRMWCQNNVWDKCDDCGREPVKFVLAESGDDPT